MSKRWEPTTAGSGSLARGFRNAFRGVLVLLKSQRNARIHGVLLVLVAAAGAAAGIGWSGWALIALAAGMVLSAEAMNTALEKLADRLSPGRHPLIRDAKDLAAAAVLLASLAAVVVGAAVFCPVLMHR